MNVDGQPRRYSAIIADPPWRYSNPRALVGNGGRGGGGADKIVQADVDQHYATLPLDEICALPIPAADDCLLFLWVTNSFLCDGSAARVVRAWGFNPKTVITWAKVQKHAAVPSMKSGHWFRSASEHVVFAVRGHVRRPAAYPSLPTWFPHPRLSHSVKPDTIHEYVQLAAPAGPWLEMFARRTRPGWDAWGDEI